MVKVLYLILFREWFDQIARGDKKVEYRDKTPFWTKRLFNEDGNQTHYDMIVFTNGYGPDRPRMQVEFLGVREREEKYEILLGKVLKIGIVRELR